MRVVVAAELGRLREGLLAMLDSVLASRSIVVVDAGPEALEAVQAERPDLALLDGQLLEGGHDDLIGAIKQGWSGVRCLVVAERLGPFQPLLEAGADRYC